jgi:hypothetical protein
VFTVAALTIMLLHVASRLLHCHAAPSPRHSVLPSVCLIRLGSPRVVLAPMVDQSELAFRMFCRANGCGLAFSPMLYASVVSRAAAAAAAAAAPAAAASAAAAAAAHGGRDDGGEHSGYLFSFFKSCPGDRPLAIQLAGSDASQLATAALLVAPRCDIVDLNVGCPQAMVRVRACVQCVTHRRWRWRGGGTEGQCEADVFPLVFTMALPSG